MKKSDNFTDKIETKEIQETITMSKKHTTGSQI